MLTWLNDQGAKILTGLVTVLAGVNKVDPALADTLLGGTEGKKWWALGLGVAALLHTTVLTPSPKPGLPPPQNGGSSGRARTGFLVCLAAAGAAVVWVVYDTAHHAAGVVSGAAFAPAAASGQP